MKQQISRSKEELEENTMTVGSDSQHYDNKEEDLGKL